MKEEKRNLRGYKIQDTIYKKAQTYCAKTETTLAQRIEKFVTEISKLKTIKTTKTTT